MSFQAMTWAVEQELPALQKLVLLMLANRSNSDTGRCDPSHERLAKDCGMSKESVKRAIAQLAVDKILEIVHRSESGVSLPNQYILNIGGVGSDRTHGGVQQTPGVGSDRPTNQEVKTGIETKTIGRASRLPQDWFPSQDLILFCKSERPDLDPSKTSEQFRDYWHSKSTGATKLNWDLTFKNWVRNQRQTNNRKPTWYEENDRVIAELTGRNRKNEPDDGYIDV